MRSTPFAIAGAAALGVLLVTSEATSQRLLPGRTDLKTPSTELVTWFDFTGGSLEDKVTAPRGTMKRMVTLLPGAAVDPDTKSFLKVDGRGQNFASGKQTATISRAAGSTRVARPGARCAPGSGSSRTRSSASR